MKYRELLQLYKEGTLDEDTRKEIEETLEREEAILDYLFESSEVPGLEEDAAEPPANLTEPVDELEEAFKRTLQRSIRKAFIKMGAAVGAILLVCILLIEFVLPHVVGCFYYDPGEVVASDEEGAYQTNRMSLDLAVYTELFLPGKTRSVVNVNDNGYGSYDINIPQNVAYQGNSFVDVNGRIDRNKLILYDANALKLPTGNAFEWSSSSRDTTKSLSEQIQEPVELSDGSTEMYYASAAGGPEDSLVTLQELEEDRLYLGYVAFDQISSYDTVTEYLKGVDYSIAWCAVQTDDTIYGTNIGFNISGDPSMPLCWDNETYPLLQPGEWGESVTSSEFLTAEDAIQHFTSLLNYLKDQPRFLNMMDPCLDSIQLEEMADYVAAHGLNIYGVALIADKETLLKLMDTEEVYSIYVEPL